eukprot:757159_1
MWEYKRFYLDRYFSCSTRSMVSISFYYAFCLSAEANDYVQVGLDDTYSPEYNMKRDLFTGTKLEEIDAGETYRRDLPDTVSSYCDAKGDWWYKTVSDYSAGSVERGVPFLITLSTTIGSSLHYAEYASLFNIRIECIQLPTTEPTPEPTINPSATPSISPTAAPSISPIAAPSTVPSSAPTLAPTIAPSILPTLAPSAAPTTAPSAAPSLPPTLAPSVAPSLVPSQSPTACVDYNPT